MKSEQEIKDMLEKLRLIFNDEKNPNYQRISHGDLMTLKWVLGEYDEKFDWVYDDNVMRTIEQTIKRNNRRKKKD